jgi:transcriptional regulator with XRE-family HTH domain
VILRGFVLELTKRHDLSQTEIAKRSGLSQPLIHKILTGMGTPQVQSYQKLASAFPEAWNDYLLRHPALQEDLSKAFGWVNRAGGIDVGARQDDLALLERVLGLDRLPPVPPEAHGHYQKRFREVMRRASRELQEYRKTLQTNSRTRKGRQRRGA